MSISFDRVNAGDTLYDVHREKMGNTTMSRTGCWSVYVVSIDTVKQTARVRWNCNAEQTYTRRQIERLRRSPPKER